MKKIITLYLNQLYSIKNANCYLTFDPKQIELAIFILEARGHEKALFSGKGYFLESN